MRHNILHRICHNKRIARRKYITIYLLLGYSIIHSICNSTHHCTCRGIGLRYSLRHSTHHITRQNICHGIRHCIRQMSCYFGHKYFAKKYVAYMSC